MKISGVTGEVTHLHSGNERDTCILLEFSRFRLAGSAVFQAAYAGMIHSGKANVAYREPAELAGKLCIECR